MPVSKPLVFGETRTRRRSSDNQLYVERTDIAFDTDPEGVVCIEIEVKNAGAESSAPALMKVEAAPLGAFVPWQLLKIVTVPSIPAMGSTRVRLEVPRPDTPALGDFSTVSPMQLISACTDEDDPQPFDERQRQQLRQLLGDGSGPGSPRRIATGELPNDPFDLLDRRGRHWAGNLNVFIGKVSVERHQVRSLRVYPGRTNLAAFFVGAEPDEYSFQLAGDGACWTATLHDLRRAWSIREAKRENMIQLNSWVATSRMSVFLLAVHPPEFCTTGAVEVHVQQRSSGQVAIVEFSLNPDADGPGCYTV